MFYVVIFFHTKCRQYYGKIVGTIYTSGLESSSPHSDSLSIRGTFRPVHRDVKAILTDTPRQVDYLGMNIIWGEVIHLQGRH